MLRYLYLAFNESHIALLTMQTIALLYTERSEAEKDLGKMIRHLETVLGEIEDLEVVTERLNTDTLPNYTLYGHLVFCGYDHITLGHIHLAMAVTDPAKTRITLYDEPGAAIDRELSAIMFRAIDLRRAPGSSATRLISSWSHRDIVVTARQDVLKSKDGASRNPKPTPGSSPAPARSGKPGRNPKPRKVDAAGTAPAREGDAAVGGEDGVTTGSGDSR